MDSIASGYRVKLVAAVQNIVQGFTSATITDSDAISDTADFVLYPERRQWDNRFKDITDPEINPYQATGGEAVSDVTFTGDSVEIRLAGPNEYFLPNDDFYRTALSGVIIEYDSIVSPGLPGDFNTNGTVDAADYVVWRETLRDQPNYDLWKANFGRTGGIGSSQTVVPEPVTGLSCVISVVVLSLRRSRQIGRSAGQVPRT
jgi:hypothetical protein